MTFRSERESTLHSFPLGTEIGLKYEVVLQREIEMSEGSESLVFHQISLRKTLDKSAVFS